ncbi:glycine betaine ABC transporter substrate-binding protein [Salinisphaera japonica]|uniref:Glycine/betaine ABC transporter substrate-binding protein n=1 Tax=Salinisphaera japonica YTM-1 TaxID=1209778 RepID=A0A423PWS3_9GAMM|nr:glycine betaine ABC transporter substrate-binding protein [Salinisphaera japonica]ROO30029.1 glycine/betaine ABC transporter substrate-binding protein [Salinisphaera japonica YTM-1]
MKTFSRIATTTLLAAGIALAAVSGAAAQSGKTVKIGWTAWSDAEFVTKLFKSLVEARTDYTVKLQMSAIGVQYQGVANGDLDAMLMAWLPDTHADYYDKFENDVENLGTLYEDARLGWVVPSYVPEDKLASISDLKKPGIADKLSGKIQGIDPGAGLMQLSNKTMDAYGLGDSYRLVSASGAAMTAALSRAYDNKDWIVVTGWTPHWMFGKWDLRFLKDSKGTLGKAQHIDALGREGFSEAYPQLAGVLSKMHIPLADLQAAMYAARESDYDTAIADFVDSHSDLVDSWFADDK